MNARPPRASGPRVRRTAGRLFVFCALMLGFAYVLVPLYDILCDITGLSGAPGNLTQAAPASHTLSDSERRVTLQFVANVDRAMPWNIRPDQFEMTVRPGQTYSTVFHARNSAARTMTGQAVPSVAPTLAAPHLVKQECFCFTSQSLAAGAHVEMPLVFRVSERLPANIDTLTLSYTFFDITPQAGVQPG